jgi:hypothetical protein
MVAEVAIEIAREVDSRFNIHAGALTFARAALKDASFKSTLTTLHRNIMARRVKDPRNMLAPLRPLYSHLKQEADRVLSGAAPA